MRNSQGIFVLLFVGLAFGSNWYISPLGNNNFSGTSQGSPLADLKTALNKASQGDTIIVEPGTYTGANNIGLSVTGINIVGYAGSAETVFQGQSSTTSIFKLLAGATLQGVTVDTGTNGVEVSGNSATLTDIYATSTNYGVLLDKSGTVSITNLTVSGTVSTGIGNTATSTVTSLSISNSNFYAEAGILFTSAGALTSVNITNCVFQSQAVNSRGVVFNMHSTKSIDFYLTNSTFRDYVISSSSIFLGAAVYFTAATSNVTITSCTFENMLAKAGPAIYVSGLYSLSISQVSVTNSSAYITGGAFQFQMIENISILNSNFQSCTSRGYGGGAIYFTNTIDNILISHTLFENGSAGIGGALSVSSVSQVILIDSCIFNNNRASNGGGAIQSGELLTINNTIFTNNYVRGLAGGGAIFYDKLNSWGDETSYILHSTFYNNTASTGGAVFVHSGLSFTNVTFTSNVAQNDGGALGVSDATVILYDTVFQNNSAHGPFGGGAYFGSYTTVNMYGGEFIGNIATSYGGGFFCGAYGGVLLNEVVFSANSARTGSGYACGCQCSVTGIDVYFYNGDSASCTS